MWFAGVINFSVRRRLIRPGSRDERVHKSFDYHRERATPASPISIKGLTPVEYYLPLGRVSFGQPIQAFLLGPPYPTPNIAQWLPATASAVSLDLVPPALHHGERTDHAWDIS